MKLFGIDFGSREPVGPRITPEDREWVEKCFLLLRKTYGLPRAEQCLPTATYFPHALAGPQLQLEGLITDCCVRLRLPRNRVAHEICPDLRDSGNTPYAFSEIPTDCLLQVDEATGTYVLFVASNLLKHPGWLLAAVCCELTKAMLLHQKVLNDPGTGTTPFWYVAAVYFGFGVIIGQNLTDVGRSSSAGWEQQWAYVQNIPLPVLAYALAAFARLQNEWLPDWQSALPREVSAEVSRALAYLKNVDNELFDCQLIADECTAYTLYNQAFAVYQAGAIADALALLQTALPLTSDFRLKAPLLLNIGYYNIRLANYTASIDALRNCLQTRPSQQFAHDNLGFALIMTGELEAGKQHLDLARQSGRNNEAYTDRNLAIYHQKKQEYALAEASFQQAFAHQTPVDQLDFFYGQFLLETGQPARGLEHIRAAAGRGEPDAVAWLQAREGAAGPA